MKYELPELPFSKGALEPLMSSETLEFHYGKHHRGYVDKLNKLIVGTPYEHLPLIEMIKKATGPIFNNAAQHWNHTFLWNCLSPEQLDIPSSVDSMIQRDFGSKALFEKEFLEKGAEHFGSGWIWLVHHDDKLKLETTSDAINPLKGAGKALLTCDLWEHAYYLDYRNERPKFIESFFKLINWNFVQQNIESNR